MWAPSCFHGSVGNGRDVVNKYIETQDVHHANNASYRLRTYVRGYGELQLPLYLLFTIFIYGVWLTEYERRFSCSRKAI